LTPHFRSISSEPSASGLARAGAPREKRAHAAY
jgi:hypothetical protein